MICIQIQGNHLECNGIGAAIDIEYCALLMAVIVERTMIGSQMVIAPPSFVYLYPSPTIPQSVYLTLKAYPPS